MYESYEASYSCPKKTSRAHLARVKSGELQCKEEMIFAGILLVRYNLRSGPGLFWRRAKKNKGQILSDSREKRYRKGRFSTGLFFPFLVNLYKI